MVSLLQSGLVLLLCLGFAEPGTKVNRIAKRRCLTGFNETIYEHSFETFKDGANVPFSKFKGKLVLIANVATY